MAIKSNLGTAQQRASALKNATESLNSGGSISNDSQTTVAGNQSAQNAIQSTLNAAKKITEVVRSSSSSIKSVAANFEAIDQAGKKLFTREKF